jgi:hypothetical protein
MRNTCSRLIGASAAILAAFPASAQTPGRILYAVIGATDPNNKVPALDAVPGAGISNVSVALPVDILLPGVSYTVVFGVQNLGFNGTCTASYILGAGANGEQVISNYYTEPYTCAAHSIWTFPFPVGAIPNIPGPALLTATVQFGTTSINYNVRFYIK